jgi:hypothetical protein
MLEIAGGIILAVLVLAFWPIVLRLAIGAAALVVCFYGILFVVTIMPRGMAAALGLQ